ncbi:uncharacterized protein LOC110984828 [Acanthaster planci]|uniref:Uncharacterized protein LOC110984828 n=1 Tax=Acanthaster planci TaxID=133434 RepID=A0A8B7Z7Y3_ACAPL|nr:uncharacterized protein LOC110984828 [Acanthaster planci]
MVNTHCYKPDHYRCSEGRYIPNSFLCDGYTYDCLNNEDENEEHCVFCPHPGELANGQIAPWKEKYREGENVTFSCLDGYSLRGDASAYCANMTWSVDLPECYENCPTPRTPALGSHNASSPVMHLDVIGFTCYPGYALIPDTTVICNNGTLEGRIPTCQDINECESSPCLNGGRCSNLVNAFKCMCTPSWTGTNCSIDIDECTSAIHNCHTNATCNNTIGGYGCACNEGFRGNGFLCREIIMFPFGVTNGDSLLSGTSAQSLASDIVSNIIKPEYGFPLGYKYFFSGLYFTDNGQIIFTNRNDMLLAFPHPFPGGFNRSDSIAVVAPFWIDANPFAGDAEVFYQIYTNTSGPVMQDALSRIKAVHTSFSSWTPDWMLVVTWYKLPSFIETINTNTFQVALVTDGDYSFAVVNFPEGEMQWNYNALSDTDVIIGFRSGRSLFVNSQKASPFTSIADKFRPDSLIGNTGLKGRWVYRLDSNNRRVTNPKRFCRWWYNRQPDPRIWNRYLGTCPCAFSQGGRDSKYGRRRSRRVDGSRSSMPLSDAVLNAVNNEEDGFCLRTQFPPTRAGAGMVCCYRADRSLITGYKGPFELSVTERIGRRSNFFLRLFWIFLDFYPRFYCCDKANDETFCDMYFEKRPKGSCSGYLPPTTGWMMGDPHITTLDGVGYTFNGLGEYTQFLLPDSNGEALFEIQGRTMRAWNNKTGELSQATQFIGFVGQANDSAKVQMVANENLTDVDVFVNDELFNKTLIEEDVYEVPNASCIIAQKLDANNNTRYQATWTVGTSMEVGISLGILDIIVSAPAVYKNGSSRGLLGVWNGDPSDDFLKRNETLLTASGSDGNYTDSDFFKFGETWRTTPETSLFLYPSDTTWADYNNLTFIPLFLDELIAEAERDDPTFLAEIRSSCGDNDMCLFDSLATKNMDIGMATMAKGEENQQNAAELANFPPTIDNGTNVILARVGDPVEVQVMASDPDGDAVTFSLVEDIEGASLNQAGLFTWNPANVNKVSIGIRASDGSANAVFEPTVKVCNCQNNGTCLYDQYVENTNIMKDNFAVVVCNCTPGWSGDFCEVDFNACQDSPCFDNVTCIDLPPPEVTNTCGPCPDNLQGNGFTCYDLDECNAPGGSPCSQLCANFLGGYNCSCNSGYVLDQDMHNCTDVDECMQANGTNCHMAAVCNNTAGAYVCYCPEGYTDVNGDGTLCEDINECLAMPPVCTAEMDCQNNVGSYECSCSAGYENENETCVDIDECARNTSDCGEFATCRNVPGQFVCRCEAGFRGDGYNCSNIDECQEGLSRCTGRSVCQDTLGSYLCQCDVGFVSDGTMCEDLDECNSTMSNNCSDVGSMCVNSPGSYTCRCLDGYEGDGFTCQEVLITTKATILAKVTSGVEITTGMRDSATQMMDREEDAATQSRADEPVTIATMMTDVEDAGTADTATGGDEATTLGTANESVTVATRMTGDEDAGTAETATEEVGLATQSTADEFVTMATRITGDEDAGTAETATEEVGAASQSTADEEFVTMATRMTGDEDAETAETATEEVGAASQSTAYEEFVTMATRMTGDEDAETTETATEKVGAASQSTADEEFVTMATRMTGDKDAETAETATDEVEAATQSRTDMVDVTMEFEMATNEIVTHNPPQATQALSDEDTTGTEGNVAVDAATAAPLEVTAAAADSTAADEQAGPTAGITVPVEGTTEDVDGCSLPGSCAENSMCENTAGSLVCTCNAGYQGDGFNNCTDIDECLENPSLCDRNATCTNLAGNYTCQCNAGLQGDGTTSCTDIDECLQDPAVCDQNAMCTNLYGSYICECNEGYFGNGKTCTDVNECSLTVPPCVANSMCQNSVGSFTCTCSVGYEGDGLTSCSDIDECSRGLSNCYQNATCTNTDGSFDCRCDGGFSGDGEMCTDIDECVTDPNICTGYGETCLNVEGSFSCVCNILEGFAEVNGTCQLFTSFRGSFVINAINGNSSAARYVPALADPSSPQFIAVERLVCALVRAASESNSELRENFQNCQVVEFTESDQTRRKRAVSGFVLAVFAAMFQLNAPVEGNTFQNAVTTALSENTGSLSADVSSLTLAVTRLICVDGHCLNGAICSVDITNQIVCTCPDGYIGARCDVMGTDDMTDTTTPGSGNGGVITEIIDGNITNSPDSDTMVLLIILISLAGIAVLVLVGFMFILCIYLHQRSRSRLHSSVVNGNMKYLTPRSDQHSEWHHGNGGFTEMDRQMQYLAENISQSPYYRDQRRSELASPVRLSDREFVQPYLATGLEAHQNERRRVASGENRMPSRANGRTSSSPNRAQSIRHFWDN